MYGIRIWHSIGSKPDVITGYATRDEAILAAQWCVEHGAVGVAVYKV